MSNRQCFHNQCTLYLSCCVQQVMSPVSANDLSFLYTYKICMHVSRNRSLVQFFIITCVRGEPGVYSTSWSLCYKTNKLEKRRKKGGTIVR